MALSVQVQAQVVMLANCTGNTILFLGLEGDMFQSHSYMASSCSGGSTDRYSPLQQQSPLNVRLSTLLKDFNILENT